MYLHQLNIQPSEKIFTDRFGGYRSAKRVGDGEFTSLVNFTGDESPVLSTRNKRILLKPKSGTVSKLNGCKGMARKTGLTYVDRDTRRGITAGHLYYNETDLYDEDSFSLDPDTEKQIVSMGTYLIVFPDMKYVNTASPNTDAGSINAVFENTGSVKVSLCSREGKNYQKSSPSSSGYVSVSASAPQSPGDGALWLDISQSTPEMKKWYSASSAWIDFPSYVKLSATSLGRQFEKGDNVEIAVAGSADEDIAALAGTRETVKCTASYIVFEGVIGDVSKTVSTAHTFTVSREAPEMDYVVECANRLWGCRHGVTADGKTVNEIYCSKLGDFKNWKSFSGISTDSWAASVGTDGDFTGAYSFQGHPIFFKEECFHKIYVSDEGAHRIVTNSCRGVQAGSFASLANVDSVLYYKSADGIYAYDGSNPVKVSAALGKTAYSNAVAASSGQKYYVSMKAEDGTDSFFVYDTTKKAWYTEKCMKTPSNQSRVKYMAETNGGICCVDEDGFLWSITGALPEVQTDESFDETVSWEAETGWLGYEYPDRKYISRLCFRLYTAPDTEVGFFIRYDNEEDYICVGSVTSGRRGTVNIPIIPRRCERMKIKLSGSGQCSLYSVTRTVERGSEL